MSMVSSACYTCTACAVDGKHFRILAEHIHQHTTNVQHFRRLMRRLRLLKDQAERAALLAKWRPTMPRLDDQVALYDRRIEYLLHKYDASYLDKGEPLEKALAESAHVQEVHEVFEARVAQEVLNYQQRQQRRAMR